MGNSDELLTRLAHGDELEATDLRRVSRDVLMLADPLEEKVIDQLQYLDMAGKDLLHELKGPDHAKFIDAAVRLQVEAFPSQDESLLERQTVIIDE